MRKGPLFASGLMASVPYPVKASGVKYGEQFSATFDGVGTLGLLISALVIFLGYRLMIIGMKAKTRSTKSHVTVGMKSFNIAITNATPGVVFAALGCVGMVASLWHLTK